MGTGGFMMGMKNMLNETYNVGAKNFLPKYNKTQTVGADPRVCPDINGNGNAAGERKSGGRTEMGGRNNLAVGNWAKNFV
jgi:hypothetical protein